MSLDRLNNASIEQAQHQLLQCCTSQRWVERMIKARPFSNAKELSQAADLNWLNLTDADYLQAFEGHPKIGDVSSLKAKYASTKSLAAGEQSSVNDANDSVIDALAKGNRDYENKFGFIFIVCATGKSAQQMLDLLEERLPNNRDLEVKNAAEEQRKIFQLRLEKLLG